MLAPDKYDTIAVELDSQTGVAVLRIDRAAQHNAVNDQMHSELSTLFGDVASDERISAIVLTGAGRTFSVGGDTDPGREYRSSSGLSPIEEAKRIIDSILDLEKPFICAVNGHAIGLGATLASLADVSFTVPGAQFGDPHVHAALPAGNGSAVVWPLLVGVNRAKRLLMAGELLTTDQAVELGLLSEVVAESELMLTAVSYAEQLAALAPQAVRGTKAIINRHLRGASDSMLGFSLALEEEAMRHPDFRAALAALNARRP